MQLQLAYALAKQCMALGAPIYNLYVLSCFVLRTSNSSPLFHMLMLAYTYALCSALAATAMSAGLIIKTIIFL